MVKSQDLILMKRRTPAKESAKRKIRNGYETKIFAKRAVSAILLFAAFIVGVILIARHFARSAVEPYLQPGSPFEVVAAAPSDSSETREETEKAESGTVTETDTEANAETWTPDPNDVEMIARTIWGEGRGVESKAEKAAIVWCILNRVDAEGYACGNSIEYVVTFPHQFDGYDPSFPVTEECVAIAEDVLARWHAEREGAEDVGRVLPKEYIYFIGDGTHNYFTIEWKGTDYWDWSLPSPYSGEGASYGMD